VLLIGDVLLYLIKLGWKAFEAAERVEIIGTLLMLLDY